MEYRIEVREKSVYTMEADSPLDALFKLKEAPRPLEPNITPESIIVRTPNINFKSEEKQDSWANNPFVTVLEVHTPDLENIMGQPASPI